jgi:GNAT superfamily N-acetyltransferase
MILISLFQNEDLQNLYDLFSHWDRNFHFDFDLFEQSISLATSNNDYKIIIAKEKNTVIGYAQICKCFHLGFEPFYEVIQLLVSEKKRRQGIGIQIMKKIEELALLENIRVIKLSSQVHRSMAHVFYENLNYEFTKISKFYEKKLSKI